VTNEAHYITAQALTIILTLSVVLFIALRARRHPLAVVFGVYNLAIAAWAASWVLMITGESKAEVLFWGRFLHIPAILVALTFVHFSLAFSKISSEKTEKIILLLGYSLGLIGMFFPFHVLFMPDAIPLDDIPLFPRAGPLYPYFLFYFIALCICGSVFLLVKMVRVQGHEKKQLIFITTGYALGYFGGGQAFLPVYGIPLPIFAFYLVSVAHLFVFYAIFKHGFMAPKIIIRRAALLVAIYVGLVLISFPFLIWIRGHSFVYSAGILVDILLMAFVLSLGPFLYAYFVRRNTYFHEHTMAGITHELKSPLSAIEGALDLLIYEAQKKADDPKQKEYLEMIDRNSARLRGFVDELLLVMKSGAKKTQLNFEPVNMANLCRDVVSTFEEAAKTKGNKLIFWGELSFPLNADPTKIKKVLSNLLSNANKFTKDGAITVSLVEEKDHVKVLVTDTGLGLAAGDIPYVFDTFYQTSAGQKAKGTGIGLSIAKLWVEAHGGSIGAESDGERKGSCFWFTLPR
jgi:signal transduction histidine kinase